MTDTLPERIAHAEPAVRGVDLIAVASQLEHVRTLGETLIRSGLLPDSIRKPEAAVAVMIKGQELSIGPMYALSHIAIINGKPALSAELMGALAKRAGHRIRVIEMTNEVCVVEGIRADDPGHKIRVRFDMNDARRAGVAGKGPWKTYPADMLRSRAISRLCRSEFQDAIAGASYTPEELGAAVDEDGEIVDVSNDVSNEPQTYPEPESQGEVEAVEGETTLSDDHRAVLEEVARHLDVLEDLGKEIDRGQALEYAGRSYRHAVVSEQKLRRAVEEAMDTDTSSAASSAGLTDEETREIEESVTGEEPGRKPAQREKGELPATRKQLNFLESLIVDVVEDGIDDQAFEEMVGAPLNELTRAQASEWIDRLSGRQA